MKEINRPEQQPRDTQTVPPSSTGWFSVMEESGQRMRRFQHAAEDFQETINRESVGQLQEMIDGMARISEAFTQAAQEDRLTGIVSAQPRVLDCVMEITRNSNRRLLRITESMNACSARMAGTDGADDETAPGPGTDDDMAAQGASTQSQKARKPAAADGGEAEKTEGRLQM